MIRAVIDTNILVSALLQPEGLPAAVFMMALSGQIQLCVSDAIFEEYEEVIRRPRLKRPLDVVQGTLQSIRKLGHWVEPSIHLEECTDPTITFFSNALRRHFPDRWKKIKVVSARELIELLMVQEK
jgi:uncharacterized protein